MITEVTSKQQLEALTTELRNKSTQLGDDVSNIMSVLNGISDYDGISISQAANTLANNLQTVTGSLNGVITSISSYIQQINTVDTYNLTNNEFNNTLNNDNNSSNESVIYTGSNSMNNNYNYSSMNNNDSSNNSSVLTNTIIGGTPLITTGINNSNSNNNSNEQLNSSQRAERVVISVGDSNYKELGKYTSNSAMGFNVTKGNFAYELTEKDFDLLCAIVASEGNLSYDESLAVVSTILNRCDNGEFISKFGKDPIAQITGLNQFASFGNGSYKSYLNGKAPTEVINAVKDALAGVRNHSFCNYKANTVVDFSNNMITASGNRYK